MLELKRQREIEKSQSELKLTVVKFKNLKNCVRLVWTFVRLVRTFVRLAWTFVRLVWTFVHLIEHLFALSEHIYCPKTTFHRKSHITFSLFAYQFQFNIPFTFQEVFKKRLHLFVLFVFSFRPLRWFILCRCKNLLFQVFRQNFNCRCLQRRLSPKSI